MGLLFWLIIQARVTAASVIKPVMMIWFHHTGRIKKTQLVSMSESGQRSSALCLLHCGVSHRACQGPLQLSHIGHREDVEAQSMASPQKPLWPWSVVWGQTASPRATTKPDSLSPLLFETQHQYCFFTFSHQNSIPLSNVQNGVLEKPWKGSDSQSVLWSVSWCKT